MILFWFSGRFQDASKDSKGQKLESVWGQYGGPGTGNHESFRNPMEDTKTCPEYWPGMMRA